MAPHQGFFKPRNPSKYKGDPSGICYRSGWEAKVMNWLDTNDNVLQWSSEEPDMVVPYKCITDNKFHRYFVDFRVVMSNGTTYLIELKPKYQTLPPVRGKKKQSTYLNEVLTYGKNISKWKAAKKFAEAKGWKFLVWTEDHMLKIGIPILNGKSK